ncbi:MAG: c-type cytochrome [Thiobacillaceae bacterium]|nr:c-type cytochrome [Thiobacillaceae bacterium]
MAEHIEMKKTTPQEFVLALLGGLFAPLIAIILIIVYVMGIQDGHSQAQTPADEQAVLERIRPIGVALAIDPKAPRVERTGEQVYNEVCAACHASGALGAPKYKDAAAWGKRIAQGYDTLLTHAIKGFHKMPARGGDPDLTDLEVARAMVYMTNAAGAKFEAVLKQEPQPSAEVLARGQAVYAQTCARCHDTGLTGAQRLSDVQAWQALIQQGKEYLYKAAIEGTLGGPPRGGDERLGDAEVKAAVDYMVEEAKKAIAAATPVKQAGAR